MRDYFLKIAVFILPVCEICHSHGSHDATSCVVLFDFGVSITEGTKIIAFRAVGSKIISTESCIGMYCHEHENVWMWLWNVSGC